MKKYLSAFLAAALLAGALPALPAKAASAPSSGVTINVYNWGEYISPGTDGSLNVNAEFTKRTGIKVNYTTYEDNESLYSKLVSGGASYDVIVPSDYMIAKMIGEKLIQKLDFSEIPNYRYINSQYRNQVFDPKNEYSIPYTWGVIGIFYNKKYVKEEVDDWKILWNPKYTGKILMFDNPRDAFGIAQKILGFSYNSTKSEEWTQSAKLLEQQKPLVQAYVMDQIFDKMSSGEAWLAPYYAGDAATLVSQNKDIGFSIPTKEGANFFVDSMCVPTSARHKKEAEAYINFLCEPEIAAANMDYVGYSTPEDAAKKLLPQETQENPIIYPPQSVMDKTETYTNLPDDTSLLLDTLWAQVKMGGPGQTATLAAVLAGFLALYIGIVAFKKVKKKKELK